MQNASLYDCNDLSYFHFSIPLLPFPVYMLRMLSLPADDGYTVACAVTHMQSVPRGVEL